VSAAVNGGLGGRFSFNVTSAGMVTGKLYHGSLATALPFAGHIVANSNGSATAVFTVHRESLHPLILSASIATGGASLTGSLALDGQSATLSGRHFMAGSGAAPLAATYNAVIRPPTPAAGDPPAPLGAGRLRVVVVPTGAITVTGSLADGNSVSFGTNLNNDATIPLLTSLSTGPGTIGGLAKIATVSGQRTLTSTLSWQKKAALGARNYPAGFALTVPLAGREFSPPAFLVLTDKAKNARLDFTGAGLAGASQGSSASQTFTLTTSDFAVFATGSANPCQVTMTVNPMSGGFSGTFVLKDGALLRTVAFSGLFVPGDASAFGYFRLPQLPAKPQAATVPLTTPILSGLVELHAAP
jgi:hypothetical protein